ncbi:ABC transporter permease [Gorillibacterium massiliense]|uniref:ABC transporter permease n=1 Tax=Gorillibacterium massiliense TaxID=1280390 RepID=UPI0004AFC31A|nr:ABC transporter permease [Gorillibacterium massiliense]
MFLALREMRHAKARYVLIFAIMVLVSFLVLFVTGLAKGLSYANISALENIPANHYVLQSDAEGKFRSSLLTENDLDEVRAVVGADSADALSVQTGTVVVSQADTKADVAFFAVDMKGMLAPNLTEGTAISNDSRGQVIVDESLKDDGMKIGGTITDLQSGKKWVVAGFAKDRSYSHMPVIFMNRADGQELQHGNPSLNAGAGSGTDQGSFNVIAVQTAKGDAAAIGNKVNGVEVISKADAISKVPGYSAEQSSLLMMVVFLLVISAFVLAVFFYVMTIQKTTQFGIMKAIGTRSSYLAWSVLGQVLLLTVAGLVVSILLTSGMAMALPDTMPFRLVPSTITTNSALFLVMALAGSLTSVIRVIKIDPLEAMGRASA